MNGIISKDLAKFYTKLFELRQSGDYDDLFNLSEEDVQPYIIIAEQYISFLQKLLSK